MPASFSGYSTELKVGFGSSPYHPGCFPDGGSARNIPDILGRGAMRRGLISLSIMVATAALSAGCGNSSSDAAAGREAGEVARAYTAAMWQLDFHKACELEFTNRHGLSYRGMTEEDKKRECEEGWRHNRPFDPGVPGPGELGAIKRIYGLSAATLQSADVSGNSATVVLLDRKSHQHRSIRLHQEGSGWLVYEEEVGYFFGP